MSQVDDWSDGYTSDYLRNLNTYGPASADVPRPSSVVSRRVQYQPPVAQTGAQTEAKTNDTPLYDNAGGFNPGPQRLVSAPARSFRGNATATQRAARPKPAVKKKTQSASKQQPQSEYRTGGARTPEENEITRSAAEHRTGADLGQLSSQALDAAARFLPALKLLGFGAGAGSADTASTDRPSYMGAAGTMADNFARALPQPSAASRQTASESSSTEGQFKNMPWYKDAKAHHEAVKKNMDDYGYALGSLKSTWDDIPWWTKLVMLPPVFKAGSPAAGASTAGNVLAEGGRAAAGDAAAGAEGRSFGFDLSAEDITAANAANAAARQQAIDLSEMRSVLMRSGMPDREIEAYMHRAGFYNDPEALRQAISTIHKHGMSGLFERSAEEAAAAGTGAGSAAGTGAGSAAGTGAGSAAGTGSRGSFGFDLSPEEIASAKASHDAYVRGTAGVADGGVSELAYAGNAGREAAAAGEQAAGAGRAGEAAADGGVSELANAGNAGRETAAGAATGSVSEGVDSASQLIEHIRSGTLDEMERAWIEATAAGAAKAPGTVDASTQAILNEARAAGILGRDAAGTAGTGAGSAAGTGAGSAAGEQAASREAIVAARNAAVAQIDPQLQAALANVRKSLANHNISPRQVLQELGSPTASDKDFYEIGRIFFEVDRATHGAGLSPAERAVADAYIKGVGARMSQDWTRVGRGLAQAADKNTVRDMIDSIKDGTLDPNSAAYIRLLATRNAELTPDAQALIAEARAAGILGREAAGTAGAADGGVSELANAGNAGREAAAAGGQAAGREAAAGGQAAGAGRAGEAAGSVSEGVNSASQQLIEHIRSGTLDEMERAWIDAIADAVRVPGTIDASTQAVLNEARFAGLIP